MVDENKECETCVVPGPARLDSLPAEALAGLGIADIPDPTTENVDFDQTTVCDEGLIGLNIGGVPTADFILVQNFDGQETAIASEQIEEAKAAAVASTAKRVTPALVDAAIKQARYWHVQGTTMTVCVLVLTSGLRDNWTVVGTSGCYDPANYHPQFGREAAFANARQKVFELLAYDAHKDLVCEKQVAERLASAAPSEVG